MEKNDCTIKNCWCKCETKNELKCWTFDEIAKIVRDVHTKKINQNDGYIQIEYLTDGNFELSAGLK